MKKISAILQTALMALVLLGCESRNQPVETRSTDTAVAQHTILGNYVSDSYDNRQEGYDWVAVIVKESGEDQVRISVRSRADKKRPTCTFDAVAYKMDDLVYHSVIDGKTILYTFSDSSVAISAANPEDEGLLYYYCSGGATLAGDYHRINSPLDQDQVDKTIFSRVLELQKIGFGVTTVSNGEKEQLTISPYGLEISNTPIVMAIDGTVTHAEIEDLNSDGYPEIVVYTVTGENRTGDVLGCSVNNGKSMSPFYFPPTADNPAISEGYNGYDEFSLVETSLVQRFPIFEEGQETGQVRQVQYKLEEGEAMRVFVVKNVSVYDKPN